MADKLKTAKDVFVGAVNPRFSRFKYAFTLAALVILATVGAVFLIFWFTAIKCEETCNNIPVGVLQKRLAEKSTLQKLGLLRDSPLKCYGFKTTDWTFSGSTEQSSNLPLVIGDSLGQMFTTSLAQLVWQPMASRVSACSHLHHGEPSRRQWLSLFHAMLAYSNTTRDLPANWTQTYATIGEGQKLVEVLNRHTRMVNTTAEGYSSAWPMGEAFRRDVMAKCLPWQAVPRNSRSTWITLVEVRARCCHECFPWLLHIASTLEHG